MAALREKDAAAAQPAAYWIFNDPAMDVPGGTSTSCTTGSVTANVCDADDSRAINNTAIVVANYRQAVADRR